MLIMKSCLIQFIVKNCEEIEWYEILVKINSFL